MTRVEELREKLQALVSEADDIQSRGPDLSDEDVDRLERLSDEANQVAADLKVAEERQRRVVQYRDGLAAIRTAAAPVAERQRAATQLRGRYSYQSTGHLLAYDNPEEAHRVGMWLLAAMQRDPVALDFCRNDPSLSEQHEIMAALSTTANPAGGVLVPTEMLNRLIRLVEMYGVFRRQAFRHPMSTDHTVIPRRSGGVTAYAVSDNDSITESDPTFNQVELTAKKWATLTRISSELFEDSVISLADLMTTEIAHAFALKEDQSAFIGDGTSTYHGVQGLFTKIDTAAHTASVFTAATGNTSFGTLDLVDFEAVVGQLPQYAVEAGNARWYVSRAGWANSMQRLMATAGGNSISDIAGGTPLEFLGYPVSIVQVANSTLTAQTDTILLALGDLRMAATIGTRRNMRIVADSSRYLEFDQVAIVGTMRSAINVHDLGDTSDAGPIVALKTPSS